MEQVENCSSCLTPSSESCVPPTRSTSTTVVTVQAGWVELFSVYDSVIESDFQVQHPHCCYVGVCFPAACRYFFWYEWSVPGFQLGE